MTRIMKVLSVLGLASVYLMQLPCVNTGNGIAIPALKIIPKSIPTLATLLNQFTRGT